MLGGAAWLVAALVADGVSVTETVHGFVAEAARDWSRSARVAVITVEALPDGRIARVDESWSQPVGPLTKLTGAVVRVAGAVSKPPEGVEPILCASRVVVASDGSAAVATSCLLDSTTIEMLGWEDAAMEGMDASRDLFAGLSADADAKPLRAFAAYGRALERAPSWTLPSLVLGLGLARSGRLPEGKPHLERWAKSGGLMTAEIAGYIGGEYPRREPTPVVAATPAPSEPVPFTAQCERDGNEITSYVQEHLPQLIACVEQEKTPVPPVLPISFAVRSSGAVEEVAIEHRHFKKGALATCVRGVLVQPLAGHTGGDCPARFELTVKTLSQTAER
jgi:hypothetical protein